MKKITLKKRAKVGSMIPLLLNLYNGKYTHKNALKALLKNPEISTLLRGVKTETDLGSRLNKSCHWNDMDDFVLPLKNYWDNMKEYYKFEGFMDGVFTEIYIKYNVPRTNVILEKQGRIASPAMEAFKYDSYSNLKVSHKGGGYAELFD